MARASAVLATAALALTAGCGGGAPPKHARQDRTEELRRKASSPSAPVKIESTGSTFNVANAQGKRLIDAKVGRMEGNAQSQEGLQGPVMMHQARCRLYEDGQPSIDLVSSEAVWDGKQLITKSPAHGVTTDGKTIIDAQKMIWTADTAHLALDQAKLQAMDKGKVNFTADGPKATVLNRIVTMTDGGRARNPDGDQLTADHMRWHMQTGKLEADGHVVMTQEGVRVTGRRLNADTKMKRGKVSGATRTVLTRIPGHQKKKNR